MHTVDGCNAWVGVVSVYVMVGRRHVSSSRVCAAALLCLQSAAVKARVLSVDGCNTQVRDSCHVLLPVSVAGCYTICCCSIPVGIVWLGFGVWVRIFGSEGGGCSQRLMPYA
jgi:hypothetical protein